MAFGWKPGAAEAEVSRDGKEGQRVRVGMLGMRGSGMRTGARVTEKGLQRQVAPTGVQVAEHWLEGQQGESTGNTEGTVKQRGTGPNYKKPRVAGNGKADAPESELGI